MRDRWDLFTARLSLRWLWVMRFYVFTGTLQRAREKSGRWLTRKALHDAFVLTRAARLEHTVYVSDRLIVEPFEGGEPPSAH